jgi:hypothetical protein
VPPNYSPTPESASGHWWAGACARRAGWIQAVVPTARERVTFYTHVSGQYSPSYTKLINATVRDATHVLDGLLYHDSELRIEEHYTDTAVSLTMS